MKPTSKQYVAAAQRLVGDSDDVQVDNNERKVSRGEGGAWVRAWVWVDDADVSEED